MYKLRGATFIRRKWRFAEKILYFISELIALIRKVSI